MTQPHDLGLKLFSLPMAALLAAQFLSALADNALLVVAIGLVKSQGQAGLIPLLQEFFVIPFILLAPFVGSLADAYPKGRVMLIANTAKLVGAGLMASGLNPLLAYGLVGVGAAAYSPAKYGILSQMFGSERLVKANGMLEGSTIAAILLGVLAGGWLADYSLTAAFTGILVVYTLAAVCNLLIPRLAPEHPLARFDPSTLLREFLVALRSLWANRDARFSLLGTSLFWGSGSTLRLMLFAWVPVALAVSDNGLPAKLMGVASLGIVAGAALASALVSLDKVNRALIGGLLLGPLIGLLAGMTEITAVVILLAAIGMAGGYFVVPLNALLQERGHESVGAGHALAVQNLWENLAMLLLVGSYALANYAGLSIETLVAGFGGLLLLGMLPLALARRRA
jgi:LPLT family lysophospholipid transporter-like MFS transporter